MGTMLLEWASARSLLGLAVVCLVVSGQAQGFEGSTDAPFLGDYVTVHVNDVRIRRHGLAAPATAAMNGEKPLDSEGLKRWQGRRRGFEVPERSWQFKGPDCQRSGVGREDGPPGAPTWHLFDIPLGRSKVSTLHSTGNGTDRPPRALTLTLQLRRNVELFASGFSAHALGADGVLTPIKVNQSEYWTGIVHGASRWSQVSVHHNQGSGHITGHVRWGRKLYMIEPAGSAHDVKFATHDINLDSPLHLVVYDADRIRLPRNVGERSAVSTCGGGVHPPGTPGDQSSTTGRHRRTGPAAGSDVCGMAVVADTRFLAQQGSNVATTTQAMLTSIEYSNARLRDASFGGSSYGVAVQKVLVLTDTSADPFHLATGTWQQQDLLDKISESGVVSGISHHEHCLVHLFTAYDIPRGVQGLAWVATSSVACGPGAPASCTQGCSGICGGFGCSSKQTFFNTAYTSAVNNGAAIPTLMRLLVTAHEIGHNFGSGHDEVAACTPGDSNGGNFIMFGTSVAGSRPNNLLYSECSRTVIAERVSLLGQCFIPVPQSFCGNGVVEVAGPDGDLSTTADNEECDAGSTGDACCSTSCKLIAPATCSDANDNCCENCALASTSTVCYQEFENDVECRGTTRCNGSSSVCPDISQKAAGAACGDKGYCVGPADPSPTRCLPWCQQFGADTCSCLLRADACTVCCRNNPSLDPYCPFGATFSSGTGQCTFANSTETAPRRPFGAECTTPPETIFDPNQFSDVAGAAITRTDVYLSINAACPGGLCNAEGQCAAQESDFSGAFSDTLVAVDPNAVRAWMRTNIVGAVIVFTGLPWLLVSLAIYLHDVRKRRVLLASQSVQFEHRSNTFDLR